MLLCCEIHYSQMIAQEQARGLGFGCAIKDLSACVSEERGHGEGGGVYATLLKIWRE